MSNLEKYASSELKRAFTNETDGMQLLVIKDILELIKVFARQNHSGLSASYVLAYFNRLVRFKPIGPLTGDEDEWNEPYGENETQQNRRCSSVFRDHHDNRTAHNIEGKVFIDQSGISYTSMDSWVPVTFPYDVPEKPEIVRRDRK